jgi:hypothetical protein
MPASLRSTLHTSPGGPVIGAVLVDTSRDDLRKGYQVVMESVNVHTTYAWTLAFTPESPDRTDSTAALLAPEGSTSQTAKFNIDFEGSYLIRLVIDAGLGTEDTKFLRMRFETRFGNLKLPAAGERRDGNGVVPMDATPEGWSNDQNQNLQLLLAQVRRQATTGRILWVDANRGRDAGNAIGDYTNTYGLPGSDPAATEDDVTFTAEGHGDFQTVNEAITYANAAAARGEPAPSSTNPYFIYIKPGLYSEDLVLVAWVHLIGEAKGPIHDAGAHPGPVIIRTANAGGNTHTYDPAAAGDTCALVNVHLENTAVTSEAVLHQSGGTLLIHDSVLHQRGNGVTQGAALEISDAVKVTATVAVGSQFISDATNDNDRAAITVDADSAYLELNRVVAVGRSAILFQTALKGSGDLIIVDSFVTGGLGYGLRAAPLTLDVRGTEVIATNVALGVVLDDFGTALTIATSTVQFQSTVLPRLTFDTALAAGATSLHLDGVVFTGAAPPVVFPTAVPGTYAARLHGKSVLYENDFESVLVPGTDIVTANSQFPTSTTQDTLDLIAQVLNPAGSAFGAGLYPGGITLNAAYEGVLTYNPFTIGAGLGRRILADNGAVQILGALNPGEGIVDTALSGGLQVDGAVDIGPTVADGLGSELFFEPNPFGFGARMTLGRAIWHNELTTLQPRAAPAGFIRGGWHATRGAYALWMLTRSSQNSGTGEQGRIVVSAGRTNTGGTGNTDGAGLYLAAGDVLEAAGTGLGGYIFLTPGYTANAGIDGRVRIVDPSAATPMVILANVAYAGAGPISNNGTLHLATPDEHFAIPLLAADGLAAVVSKINAVTLGEIVAADNGGFLELTSAKRGVNSEIFVVGVSDLGGGTSAAWFTELGEIQESVVAVTTKGTYPTFVDIECTSAGVLTVYGTITATGGTALNYYNWVVGAPASPYTFTTEDIIGVDTGAGAGTVRLPAVPVAADIGRIRTVKYEAGGNPVTVDGNGNNIDGAATTPLAFLYESVDVYWNGTQWFTK